MHGTLGAADHRYDGPPTLGCQDADCHPDVAPGDGIANRTEGHFEAMSCQVCHSSTYKNCYRCHVAVEDDQPYFKTEPSEMDFKIGHNPLQGPDRPWKYVPVRHVPVDVDSFAYYGEGLLPNFDTLPTWKYATPHNIQRNTPQTETGGACHSNPEFSLTEEDVVSDQREKDLP
jgi:hypothetical protein